MSQSSARQVSRGGLDDDVQLARAAAGGDPHSLRTILERVTGRMRATAWNLSRDGHDAQDLVQEGLLKVTRPAVLERYRGDGPLDAYLLSVGVRAMISSARPGRADAARTSLVPELESQLSSEDDTDRPVASDTMKEALATLPERARAVLLLIAVGDLRYAEVARALDMEVGTVKSTYSRARATLRRQLTRPDR